MLATVAVALEPFSSDRSETLQGIARAFAAALERDGNMGIVGGAVLAVILAFATVRWLQRERVREEENRERRQAWRSVMASTAPSAERRGWMRLAVRVKMSIRRKERAPRPQFEAVETQDVAGGGVAFRTSKPPPLGTSVDFTLDLGERAPLAMRGVVVRIEPPLTSSESLVALKLGPIEDATRDHLLSWIAAQELRQIADSRRGPLCPRCRRPLPEGANEMHPTCSIAASSASVRPS